jgi:hypothetical protein
VPAHRLRVLLGAVLLGSALAMIKNAGGEIPVGVIFGVPVAVIVAGLLLVRGSEEAPRDSHQALPDFEQALVDEVTSQTQGAGVLAASGAAVTASSGAAVTVPEQL